MYFTFLSSYSDRPLKLSFDCLIRTCLDCVHKQWADALNDYRSYFDSRIIDYIDRAAIDSLSTTGLDPSIANADLCSG